MDEEIVVALFGGIMIGLVVCLVVAVICETNTITLRNEVLDDVCYQLTGNESAVAVDEGFNKLVCELPSYDSTQRILVRTNTEE